MAHYAEKNNKEKAKFYFTKYKSLRNAKEDVISAYENLYAYLKEWLFADCYKKQQAEDKPRQKYFSAVHISIIIMLLPSCKFIKAFYAALNNEVNTVCPLPFFTQHISVNLPPII